MVEKRTSLLLVCFCFVRQLPNKLLSIEVLEVLHVLSQWKSLLPQVHNRRPLSEEIVEQFSLVPPQATDESTGAFNSLLSLSIEYRSRAFALTWLMIDD
jgi:hypothetical protein